MAGNDGSGGSIANKPGSAPPPAGGQQPPGDTVTATGQKIRVDYGDANQALAHLEDAYMTLDDAITKNRFALSNVAGPGNEQPSGTFAKNFNGLANEAITKLLNQRDAISAMRDNLKAQLGNQKDTEQTNSTNMKRQ